MGSLLRDLRHGFRSLARTPAFTTTAVLTLAIGIGATVTIFSAVRAVLLRPLPFRAPAELVQFATKSEGRQSYYFSPPNFVDLERDNRSFTSLGAMTDGSTALTTRDGIPEQVPSASVTGSYFAVFGVAAALGRVIEAADAVPGADPVAVLSEPLWRRRFGADAAIVGKTIQLDDRPYRVIGVMPRGFETALGMALWVPISFTSDELATQRGAVYLQAFGRRRSDVSAAQAQQEVATLMERLAREYPKANAGLSALTVPLHQAIAGSATAPLLILLATVGMVLVVASVNVAVLMLVRSLGRRREIAVRAALGASTGRIARGLIIESTVLGLMGGALGTVLALWGTRWLASLSTLKMPLLDQTQVDGTVLAFACLISIATGVGFGLLPAAQAASGGDLATRIRDGLAGSGQAPSRRRTRDLLVTVQLAGSTALLVGATLVSKSFFRLSQVDLGFSAERSLVFELNLPSARYPDGEARSQAVAGLIDRLRILPGVERVGGIFGLPLSNFNYSIDGHSIDGRELEEKEAARTSVQVRVVTPDLFRSLGMTIVAGRSVAGIDRAGGPPVLLVNETAANLLWPGVDPVGHQFMIDTRLVRGRDDRVGGEVVGVVRDVRSRGPRFRAPPTIYAAYAQRPVDYLGFVVRTSGNPEDLIRGVQAAVASLDPNLPIFGIRTGEQLTRNALAEPRLYAILLALFAVAALLLAVIGVYGVIAETVASRTREIGIRIALGADLRALVSGVIGRGIALAALGGALGLGLAAAGSKLLAAVLFETAPTDTLTYLGSAAVLVAAAMIASYLPARRASRVDPTVALRGD